MSAVGLVLVAATSGANELPPRFHATVVAEGVDAPTAMAFAPDGRIFVAERNGRVRVVENGVLLAEEAGGFSVATNGERGLGGIAVDPDFASNGWVYFYYTASSTRQNRLVRRTMVGNRLANDELVIIDNIYSLDPYGIHNGGDLAFGPDGKLYISVGDGGTRQRASDLSNINGKILRINKDGSIPPDNPFASRTDAGRAIWVYRPAQSIPVHDRRRWPTPHRRRRLGILGGGQYRRARRCRRALRLAVSRRPARARPDQRVVRRARLSLRARQRPCCGHPRRGERRGRASPRVDERPLLRRHV